MSLHLEAVVQTYAYEAAWITYNKLNFPEADEFGMQMVNPEFQTNK